ncbi:MAG: Type 1 glutamine amidotransferase-like domain-containing protein [Patescibacteria group bacterium]
MVGGYPRKATDGGKAFSEELVKGFSEPVKILECLFARSRDNWETAYAEDVGFFQKHLPDRKLDFQLAQPDTFVKQIHWADAIYIRGGEMEPLYERLAQSPGWEKELDGKTFAGSSAGAYAITKYNHKLDTPELGEGLGLLPLKVLAHYRSDYNAPNIDWDKAERDLKSYKEDLPLVALREGEFRVFEH